MCDERNGTERNGTERRTRGRRKRNGTKSSTHMEFQRAVGIPPSTPGAGLQQQQQQDENASATPFGMRKSSKMMTTMTPGANATPMGKRGLGGKTFGVTPGAGTGTPAQASSRLALGNITNAGGASRLGGTNNNNGHAGKGGKRTTTGASAKSGKLSILSDAPPTVKTTSAPTNTESQDWLETVKARLTPSELAALRERAERYADESDESDYQWAGKTKAQQMKDLEAQQRAEVEERVRAILSGGAPEPSRRSVGTTASEGAARAAMASVRLDGAGMGMDDDFDLGLTPEDDLCNIMSPVKMDEDEDGDMFRPPSPGTALAMFDDVMDF